ncbi:hypothetical protein J3L16_15320 [Alteromonas sp. 5E99-2]|uniref:hypothetical protein n=1 Tax=Alteromonas sp. 5E99-2 TaxID=2817683 RepID=UPI001A98D6B8|nr:hypothetical protein [Alteromonas sp. 5E99-2]MBO1257063.1 hypothetical protein [Alteromonas sp. 5E99-2]
MEPKFESYTYKELLDVHKHIDRDAYPDRFQKISELLEAKKVGTPSSLNSESDNELAEDQDDGIYSKPPIRNIDQDGNYIPNDIPIIERILNLIIAMSLLTYGLYGLYKGEIYIPGKRGNGIHLYGEAVWIMFVGLICGAIVFISVVIDHYDKRDNEHKYYKFGRLVKYIGIGCLCLAIIWELVRR